MNKQKLAERECVRKHISKLWEIASSCRNCALGAFLVSLQRMPKIEQLLAPKFGQKEALLVLNQADQPLITKSDLPLTPVNYISTAFSIWKCISALIVVLATSYNGDSMSIWSSFKGLTVNTLRTFLHWPFHTHKCELNHIQWL